MVPKSLVVHPDLEQPPPREKTRPNKSKPVDLVSLSDTAFLNECGIHTFDDEELVEQNSYDVVLDNATLSECEYIRQTRKPVQDHIPTKLKLGDSLA